MILYFGHTECKLALDKLCSSKEPTAPRGLFANEEYSSYSQTYTTSILESPMTLTF